MKLIKSWILKAFLKRYNFYSYQLNYYLSVGEVAHFDGKTS